MRTDPRDAFATLVLPEIGMLTLMAGCLAGQRADAEDLVQDTLLHALLTIGWFDGSHAWTWLLKIMMDVGGDTNRAHTPRRVSLDDFDDHPTGPSAEQVVIDTTLDIEVERALRMLSEAQRQAVVLVDLYGFEPAEIAWLVGVPVGTVVSRLHRARGRVRRYLQNKIDEHWAPES